MFNWFKKRTAPQLEATEAIETIFPSAKNMLEKTATAWPTKSAEEILQGIEKESAKGKRYVYFFRANISKQTVKELRHQGYSIRISTCDDAPCFKVSW